MITFVEILIFSTAMFFVGYPVFKGQGYRGKGQEENERLGGLIHKKELAYTAIKDLEFDYKTGKLSEEDYKELKNKYETEALLILKEIDEFGKKKTVKEADENAIFCSKCGAKLKIGDNFCFKCGTKLPQA